MSSSSSMTKSAIGSMCLRCLRWQAYREDTTGPNFRVHLDGGPERRQHLLDEGEAEPHAGRVLGGEWLQLLEGVEGALPVGRGDATSGVAHVDAHGAVL